MRGDLKLSMMPVAPAAIHRLQPSPATTKPKLGFSIESIVGHLNSKDTTSTTPDAEEDNCRLTPPPAHQKVSASSPYYRSEDVYPSSYTSHFTRVVPTTTSEAHLLSNAAPMPYHGSVIPPYAPAMALTHCHGQYPLASYLMNRDYAASYPWLMSRQPRILSYRQQGPPGASFILQHFRKPKRIRTAFSPSQLLTLEHAFEKNHYVVGTERKQLAQNLNLTETQVKVWFQNRRTKHKRQKQEEEQQKNPSEGGKGTTSPIPDDSDESMCEEDEDDDCASFEESMHHHKT